MKELTFQERKQLRVLKKSFNDKQLLKIFDIAQEAFHLQIGKVWVMSNEELQEFKDKFKQALG